MPDQKPTLEYGRPEVLRKSWPFGITTAIVLAVGMLLPAIFEGLEILRHGGPSDPADLISLSILAALGLFMLWLTWLKSGGGDATDLSYLVSDLGRRRKATTSMSKRYSPSGTIRLLYALGLIAWLVWMIRLPDADDDPGLMRCLFPAIGVLIAGFSAIVFCLDRDARRRASSPVEPVAT